MDVQRTMDAMAQMTLWARSARNENRVPPDNILLIFCRHLLLKVYYACYENDKIYNF